MRYEDKISKIKELARFLINELNIKDRIIVRFCDRMVYRGSYSYIRRKHYITLNKKDNYYTLVDSLIHEIAHCLDVNFTRNEHSREWGTQFAKVYRAYLKWDKIHSLSN